MAHANEAVPKASVEALKKLKTVETEWEERLAQGRAAAQAKVAKAREAAEAAVAHARAEADKAREATLQLARTAAAQESERLVREGETEAATIAAETTRAIAAVRSKLTSAVLGEFRAESSGR